MGALQRQFKYSSGDWFVIFAVWIKQKKQKHDQKQKQKQTKKNPTRQTNKQPSMLVHFCSYSLSCCSFYYYYHVASINAAFVAASNICVTDAAAAVTNTLMTITTYFTNAVENVLVR